MRNFFAERAASLLVTGADPVESLTDISSEVELDPDKRNRRWNEDKRGEVERLLGLGDFRSELDVDFEAVEVKRSMIRATSL
jgi:hypothetical protein